MEKVHLSRYVFAVGFRLDIRTVLAGAPIADRFCTRNGEEIGLNRGMKWGRVGESPPAEWDPMAATAEYWLDAKD